MCTLVKFGHVGRGTVQRVTANATVIGSSLTRGVELFNILFFFFIPVTRQSVAFNFETLHAMP